MVGAGDDEMADQRIALGAIGLEALAEFGDVLVALDLKTRDIERDIGRRDVDLLFDWRYQPHERLLCGQWRVYYRRRWRNQLLDFIRQ